MNSNDDLHHATYHGAAIHYTIFEPQPAPHIIVGKTPVIVMATVIILG